MEKYVVKKFERPETKIIQQYEQLDVSTIYEAQGKQGIMAPHLKPILSETMIVGPAVTVTCPAGDNLMVHAAIEVCKPGDIVVITTVGEGVAGMIGELIVTALIKKGVKGVIIDSGIRDVRQIRDLGFPVWTREILSQGTTKSKGGWVNAPAICAGVQVTPGDLIVADDDGVVVIKKEDLDSTLALSHARLNKEAITKANIENGKISLDFYHLRPILALEEVHYFDTEEDRRKVQKGGEVKW